MPPLAVLGAGAGLDATLHALRRYPSIGRVLLCTPGSPADRALVQAWETDGRCIERIAVAVDASPARRLSALIANAGGDVIVLAPGAIPAPGSLDGLAAALRDAGRVASATPWSNDGELAGYPRLGERQPLPDDLDAMAASLRQGQPNASIPVGGCHAVALSGTGLSAAGGLDDASFSSTYATLVDLFLRQSAFGWRHVLASRCYVGALLEQGTGLGDMHRLTARYPDYGRRVAQFLMHDPLRALRARLLDSAGTAGEGADRRSSPDVPPQGELFA